MFHVESADGDARSVAGIGGARLQAGARAEEKPVAFHCGSIGVLAAGRAPRSD